MAEKKNQSAINLVFVFFIAASVLLASGAAEMQAVTQASFDSAKKAVELALKLVGVMALWLGMVRILEAGGLLYSLARGLKPLMTRLFPDVPAEHPAMGSMILNMSANMLGLGNAATPFGVKAMSELNKLNPCPGTATNAMCLFLAINTSSVALMPLGVIGVRAAAGASNPASIWIPTFFSTCISTLVGIIVAQWLARLDTAYDSETVSGEQEESAEVEAEDFEHLLAEVSPLQHLCGRALLPALLLILLWRITSIGFQQEGLQAFLGGEVLSHWLMPVLMLAILSYGLCRGVRMYDAVCEGAKQGFEVALRIIPFLVAIFVAIGMFRASGAMGLLSKLLGPVTSLLSMPAEVLPMAIIRPLSGGGAFGIMSEIVGKDPDSYASFLASTMMGSTETTFYVLAVYFGAVGVVRMRHALLAALMADLSGLLAACFICAWWWS